MAKPSIFSNEYQKRMKKRKIIIVVVSIIIIFAVVITLLKITGKLNFQLPKSVTTLFDKKEVEEVKENGIEENKEKQETDTKELERKIRLESGVVFTIVYVEGKNGKEVLSVTTPDGEANFDVNEAQDKVVILDNKTQELKLIDLNGEEKDITKQTYTSKKNGVYKRENILNQYPTYIWSKDPKFIDDNNIAYISNLPYFGAGDLSQYIWVENLNTGEHRTIYNSKSGEIKLLDSEKGNLKIKLDEKEKTINAEGSIY